MIAVSVIYQVELSRLFGLLLVRKITTSGFMHSNLRLPLLLHATDFLWFGDQASFLSELVQERKTNYCFVTLLSCFALLVGDISLKLLEKRVTACRLFAGLYCSTQCFLEILL